MLLLKIFLLVIFLCSSHNYMRETIQYRNESGYGKCPECKGLMVYSIYWDDEHCVNCDYPIIT